MRLPLKSNDWESIQLGKPIFLHRDVPKGWWEEYGTLAHGKFRPLLFLARSGMASQTWTEVRRMLEPIGVDQWVYELAHKYGMRDGFACPVGGRWAVIFWSRRELSNILTQQTRIVIFAAASCAALRLEQLVCLDVDRMGSRVHLTPAKRRSCVWCRWEGSRVTWPKLSGSERKQSVATSKRRRSSSARAIDRTRLPKPYDRT